MRFNFRNLKLCILRRPRPSRTWPHVDILHACQLRSSLGSALGRRGYWVRHFSGEVAGDELEYGSDKPRACEQDWGHQNSKVCQDCQVPCKKREMIGASVAVAIVLAVYIPPHAPGPGQALRTMSALSSGSNSNFTRHYKKHSKTLECILQCINLVFSVQSSSLMVPAMYLPYA